MIFAHPMWDSENQRLGMKACTPSGYAVRVWGDFVGFLSLISLFLVVPGYLIYLHFSHQFSWRHLFLLLIPLASGIIGRVMFEIGWRLAAKKKFQYDSPTMTAKWQEKGQERAFPPSSIT